MADTTTASESLSNEAAAERLEALASELRQEDDGIQVEVGNKSVSLAPSGNIDYDIEVAEREPMLGSKHESVTIELEWTTDE
ncbi:amphi-Trp domain-containing protein [Halococcus sp. IIIV-5B]|uniref:amphi-Trp domain-containing protein n=1 Tax=Halococcus sp. IIIV-5B TaxID=2321230 RepID=UPI000E7500E9|nr:amphi-Trp domain-containing protein [Halococcus sp. IIIV-5B]RJT06091.1 amphi-Trp domain-containing protein [Halococcus sp. IIIV-5B]